MSMCVCTHAWYCMPQKIIMMMWGTAHATLTPERHTYTQVTGHANARHHESCSRSRLSKLGAIEAGAPGTWTGACPLTSQRLGSINQLWAREQEASH